MNIEKYEIVYFSVVIGFLQDVFFINGFGVNIFLNIILGVLFYYVSIKYNKNKYFLSVLIVSIFCIFKSFITNIFLMIFLGVGISGLYMIYELIYIFVFSAFLYLFLGRIFKGRLFKKSLEF
ncbi:Rod shape-determining protein MreD [Candidatus Arthromitus sp. SFB-mouse-NL]|nr:Rod shape-determining protein MreD [Candidatus Arthromitus sp. SFB-mouse-NL]